MHVPAPRTCYPFRPLPLPSLRRSKARRSKPWPPAFRIIGLDATRLFVEIRPTTCAHTCILMYFLPPTGCLASTSLAFAALGTGWVVGSIGDDIHRSDGILGPYKIDGRDPSLWMGPFGRGSETYLL